MARSARRRTVGCAVVTLLATVCSTLVFMCLESTVSEWHPIALTQQLWTSSVSSIHSISNTINTFSSIPTGRKSRGGNSTLVSDAHVAHMRNHNRTNTSRPVSPEDDAGLPEMEEPMTPELIEQIAHRESDCLSPMHVHMVWIGDLKNAPKDRVKFIEMGYNLTVHTSAEEILDGFHPYVLKAYKLALPKVVGYDFLKFALLYKYGGLAVDADTTPAIPAASLHFPADCDVVFGKEAKLSHWERPIFREQGGNTYGLNRPFQILNWAMAASAPRNRHIRWLMKVAMAHFFGLRDMEMSLVQDISGSGIMTDYVALLHERDGRNYPELYRDESKYVPVEGLCLTDGYLHGGWIRHAFHGTWKSPGMS